MCTHLRIFLSIPNSRPDGDTQADVRSLPEMVDTFHRSSSSGNLASMSDSPRRDSRPRSAVGLASASGPSNRRSNNGKRSKHPIPNYRDFSPNESPFSPRTFASALPGTSPSDSDVSPGVDALFAPGSGDEAVLYLPNAGTRCTAGRDDPRHPYPFPEVATEALADFASRNLLIPGAATEDHPSASPSAGSLAELLAHEPSNFSQSGIVHLAPLDEQSRSRSSSGGPNSGRRSSPRVPHSGNGSGGSSPHLGLSRYSGSGSRGQSTDLSTSNPSSYLTSGSASLVSGSTGSSRPHTTLRYQHVEDEDGHHLIVGREGKLTRCEDEVGVIAYRSHR